MVNCRLNGVVGFVAATASAAAFALVGCSSHDAAGNNSTAVGVPTAATEINLLPKNEQIAAKVPQKIREAGVLRIVTDATQPPNIYFEPDGATLTGNEVEFGNQVASILGLTPEWTNLSFDSIIPGLQGGRFDIAFAGMADTKQREQVVDFVTYASFGKQIFARSADKDAITTPDQFCGRSVAVQSGSIDQNFVEGVSQKCLDAGKPSVEMRTFKVQSDQMQAVLSGQVDVGVQTQINNVYLEKTTPTLVGVGEIFNAYPGGIAVAKGSGLTEAVHSAVTELIDSGTYQEILAKYDVKNLGIEKSVVNGATF